MWNGDQLAFLICFIRKPQVHFQKHYTSHQKWCKYEQIIAPILDTQDTNENLNGLLKKSSTDWQEGKRRFLGFLWFIVVPWSMPADFFLVFVASVLYLLPASSTHHCCFYVSARNLQSYGFRKCLKKLAVSRDRRVRLTQKKHWTHEQETNTWKSHSRRPCRQKKLSTKSDTDSYWLHTLYVHM